MLDTTAGQSEPELKAILQIVPPDSSSPEALASSLVLATPATDDVGAETADRFEWQAAMAAADGFSLLLNTLDDRSNGLVAPQREIICEFHEDWVVTDGTAAEIVSAKHRDPASGAYTTLTKLADDGGLRHLFFRWDLLQEQVECRLVTTGGLAPGEARQLESAAKSLRALREAGGSVDNATEFHGIAELFARALLRKPSHLPKSWQDLDPVGDPGSAHVGQVRRFLSRLRIQHSDIQRLHMPFAAPAMYAAPVLAKLRITSISSAEVWEVVLSLFRQRMRAAGPLETAGLPRVLPPSGDGGDRDIQRRTVTVDDVNTAIKVACANPGGYLPLLRTPRTSRVAIKMDVGKCHDNSIERAEQLRVDFQAYWRERKSGDPLCRPAEQRLQRLLLRISDETTDEVYSDAEPWGRQFWTVIQTRLREIPAVDIPAGMDADLLLGGVSDLANRCQIWFSHRFDIEAAIEELRALRGLS